MEDIQSGQSHGEASSTASHRARSMCMRVLVCFFSRLLVLDVCMHTGLGVPLQ